MSNKPDSRSVSASEAVILDVPFLDEFFLEWVIDSLRRILQRLRSDIPSIGASGILLKYLRPITQCMVILSTRGQTPATRLLGLQRTPTTQHDSQNKKPQGASALQRDYYFRLFVYTIFSTIVPTIYSELKEWHRQRRRERLAGEGSIPVVDETNTEQVSAERKFKSVHVLIQIVNRIWPLLRLTALLGVWSGLFGTSEIAMILSGWSYQKQAQHQQEPRLHVDYAQRRWIWEEVMRSLRVWGHGLTLMSIWRQDLYRWKDYVYNLCFARLQTPLSRGETDDVHSQKEPVSCCFCEAKPVVIPIRLRPCGHSACYACLRRRRKSSVRCRLCRSRVVDATRLTVST